MIKLRSREIGVSPKAIQLQSQYKDVSHESYPVTDISSHRIALCRSHRLIIRKYYLVTETVATVTLLGNLIRH